MEEEDVAAETAVDIEIMLGTKTKTQKHLEREWPLISSTKIQIIEVVAATVVVTEEAMETVTTTTTAETIVIIITK